MTITWLGAPLRPAIQPRGPLLPYRPLRQNVVQSSPDRYSFTVYADRAGNRILFGENQFYRTFEDAWSYAFDLWRRRCSGAECWILVRNETRNFVRVLSPELARGTLSGLGQAQSCPPQHRWSENYQACIPESCPPNTPVRNLATGLCEPGPAPGPPSCLTSAQIQAAAPCFYIDPNTMRYNGPKFILDALGIDSTQAEVLCFDSFTQGYFNQPACDPNDPNLFGAPPTCLTPDQIELFEYCGAHPVAGSGPDQVKNYFCWLAGRSPQVLAQWVNRPPCGCRPDQFADADTGECIDTCPEGSVYNAILKQCQTYTPTDCVPADQAEFIRDYIARCDTNTPPAGVDATDFARGCFEARRAGFFDLPPCGAAAGPGTGPFPGPGTTAPAPSEGDSIVVPVLLGAAAIGAALYFLG